MEKSLFTAQSIARLTDCEDLAAVFRVLSDFGFGAGAKEESLDAMFAEEEKRAADFLKEFNVDGALDSLLLQYDYLNLKAQYKSLSTSKPCVSIPSGRYESETIRSWLELESADVPEEFIGIVKQLRAGVKSPSEIDCAVDKAMYAAIFKMQKRGLLREHFVRKVDLLNIGSFVRCKKLGLEKKAFDRVYIEGGTLNFLSDIYENSLEELVEKCRYTDYKNFAILATENLVAYETLVDNSLFKFWKEQSSEMFDIAPLVAFYLAKTTQIKIAKLIVAAVKNGVDKDKIKERMRELYA